MEVEVRLIDSVVSTTREKESKQLCSVEIFSRIDSADDFDVSFSFIRNVLYVHKSRVLWLGLVPLLFKSPIKAYAIQCILDQCFPRGLYSIVCPENQNSTRHDSRTPQFTVTWTRSRRFRFRKRSEWYMNYSTCVSSQHCEGCKPCRTNKSILWICPPQTTWLEYTWTLRLLRWERMYIQAQSISGYIATLGGGFFLCHHFKTAILLAQYQQQLAILLNDMVMYYTCFVHMAYSYIYNGFFRVARQILKQVLNKLITTKMDSKMDVVVRMCHSALLFARRMRRASRSIQASSACTTLVELDSNRKKQIIPMDNLRRIRVVTDKSKLDDLVIPFSKTVSAG